MATIVHQPFSLPTLLDFDGVRVRQWENMALGDVGEPINLARFSDKTVEITGNFGVGGTVVIEGSVRGVVYHTIKTVFGGDLQFTAGGIFTITEVPVYLRPRVTGGDGTTSLSIAILVR